MKLTKEYSSIFGCEVWTLEQHYTDPLGVERIAQYRMAVPNAELSDYGRAYIAVRVLEMRAAIREVVALETRDA